MDTDHDRTALWLTLIDLIIRDARAARVPTAPDVLPILRNVQSALKRWPWRARSRRGAVPSHWLIDDEADVQALLWTILSPVYGADLVDEHYLPHSGQVQPRADLGIRSLGLIIEVKMLRSSGDFRTVEEQIAADAALYFRAPAQFTQMVVVIYDDCDHPQPERYGGLVAALTRHEHVTDVVIVRRPSMIPGRAARSDGETHHRADPGARRPRRART